MSPCIYEKSYKRIRSVHLKSDLPHLKIPNINSHCYKTSLCQRQMLLIVSLNKQGKDDTRAQEVAPESQSTRSDYTPIWNGFLTTGKVG